MSDVAIRCEDVWKQFRVYHQRSSSLKERLLTRRNSYDEFWAVKGVGFEVQSGSTLGIIGSNGSGKSTLLKMLARILTPDKGSVTINGSMSSLLELGTGFHPDLTGEENVYLAGSLLGQSKGAMRRKYDAIVDFAGIESFMDLQVKNYSSGMYARLAFAVAISVEPEILVIDEVLSVGDESFQLKCYERISEFRAAGRTIVLVSHSLDTVRSLCRDAIWLDKGLMRGVGRSNDVVTEYLLDVHSHDTPAGLEPSGDRWGTGEARISDVEILDESGSPAGVMRTGRPATLRIHYTVTEPVAELAVGIALYRSDNVSHVFGQNTVQVGLDLDPTRDGVVDIRIDPVPLQQGHHVLTVALHDHSTRAVYDWNERRFPLIVLDDPRLPRSAGTVTLPTHWSAPALDASGR